MTSQLGFFPAFPSLDATKSLLSNVETAREVLLFFKFDIVKNLIYLRIISREDLFKILLNTID